jgi:DNA-binding Lrp family transcriptional regulator
LLHLDDLDIKIMRELASPASPQWNVRESYSNIARKLGVDEETVRLRIKRAKDRGFLPSWRMMVNPKLIGYEVAGLDLEVADEEKKIEVISKIKHIDGVTNIADFRGKGVVVTLYYNSEELLKEKVAMIESICGSPILALWKSRFPKPDVRMENIDWEIVEAMREDARRDLGEVASSLGVSLRTVQRRLAALREGRAVYLSGVPNVDVVGGVMCNFLVYFKDPRKKAGADNLIQSTFSRIGASDTSPEQYTVFGMSCENLSEVDGVLSKLKAMDGVTSVRMRIMKDLIFAQDWIRDQIAMRLSETV